MWFLRGLIVLIWMAAVIWGTAPVVLGEPEIQENNETVYMLAVFATFVVGGMALIWDVRSVLFPMTFWASVQEPAEPLSNSSAVKNFLLIWLVCAVLILSVVVGAHFIGDIDLMNQEPLLLLGRQLLSAAGTGLAVALYYLLDR